MPIRLADILKETKTVTFDYEGESVTVEYRHNAVTPVTRIALAAGPNYFRARRGADAPAEPAPAAKPAKGRKGGQSAAPATKNDDRWWQDALAESLNYLEMMAKLLVSWDVLGDDGEPLPVTVELLEGFPLAFINAVAWAMLTDGTPNPPRGVDLPDSSPQTD